MSEQEIIEAAMKLPTPRRIALGELLIESAEEEAELEGREAEDAELLRRIADIESGRVKPVPWAEVKARLRKRLSEAAGKADA